MPRYRRNLVPGATYFFTATLADRASALLTDHIDLLRNAFRDVRARHPFALDAIVVLPEHIHAVWTLPPGDCGYGARWRLIKSHFSRHLPVTEEVGRSKRSKKERGIWQRRYWEHTIRGEEDYARHVDYIHYNPVKHGLVSRVRDWEHSSFHRFVERGILPADWGGDARDAEGRFGERKG